jgi:peptide/nickel transport system permease protein
VSAVLKAVGARFAYGIPVFFIVTFAVAMLAEFMPGSPGQAILGDQATAEAVAAINSRYGYDLPPIKRYFNWLGGVVQLDFGQTIFTREDVSEVLGRRLVVTAELAGLALLFSLVFAIPLALIAAIKQGGILDRIMNILSSALLSIPSFVAVVIVSLIFTVWLGLFPATGWVDIDEGLGDNLRFAFLPAVSLALYEMAFFYRVLRSDLVGTLREDFVLVARAKGLPKWRIIAPRHVLRPSLSSLVTLLGLSIGRLLGGAVIAEYFFSIPGLGGEAISAVATKDMGMLQAIVTLGVVVYVVLFILVDLAYAWIDPRVSVK